MAKAKQGKETKKKLSLEAFQNEIRARAEEIFKKRGNKPGDELSDWLEAEKEIKEKHGIN